MRDYWKKYSFDYTDLYRQNDKGMTEDEMAR